MADVVRRAVIALIVAAGPCAASSISGAPEDKAMDSAFCFPEAERVSTKPFLGFSMKRQLKLEIRGWQSHRVVTRIAEILLREKLGYDVRVLDFSNVPISLFSTAALSVDSGGEATMLRLASGSVDICGTYSAWK